MVRKGNQVDRGDGKFLPGTGRGTMRSMVEGHYRQGTTPPHVPLHPAAFGVAVPLPRWGRICQSTHFVLVARGDRYLVPAQPPSTTIDWPLTISLPGEHRNAITAAMSSGLARRG